MGEHTSWLTRWYTNVPNLTAPHLIPKDIIAKKPQKTSGIWQSKLGSLVKFDSLNEIETGEKYVADWMPQLCCAFASDISRRRPDVLETDHP